MKVAIDMHPLHTTRAGVARYLRGLLGGLRAACPEVEIATVAWPYDNFEYRQPLRAWRTFYREEIWARGEGPRALERSGADLWFSPALPLFGGKGKPHVATVHDLAPLRHPERYRMWQRLRARRRLLMAAAAERIVCVSRFTADEAMRLLGVEARRIDVVPNGVTPLLEGVLPNGLPSDFFLFVGSLEPGKNVRLLKSVWQSARERGQPLADLFLVGERWPGVEREGATPQGWHFLGAVDDGALGALYRHARALVFPSLYEGFGLPVVEAMSCGCPVVCAPVASLPEVGGDAVCWAEHGTETWLEALQRLERNPSLRDELVRKGEAQAARFSWERSARETAAVWESVLR